MKKKICYTCKEEKPLSEFYEKPDRKNGSSKCKKCFNDYCIQRWIKIKIKAIEYKGSKCCDCSNTFPEQPYVIFDFHHLDPNEKEAGWVKIRLRSWDKIVKELDKCVLLCSNCHRIRHHEE